MPPPSQLLACITLCWSLPLAAGGDELTQLCQHETGWS